MVDQEAVIKRIYNGGTRSVKALKRQLDYLSRQNDPKRQNVQLVSSAQLQFEDDYNEDINSPDNINNNIEKIAQQLFRRSGRLPTDDPDAELPHDLTIHFVMSFPQGTDIQAAERAGHDWAIYVFGHGYRNPQGYVQRHKFYAAYHPPYEHDDNPNPHMHVVVDRSPRGGGNLLTLKKGHPHWSYEAMRFQAVEAAANHGIELAATTRSARGLAERALTDVEIRRRRRLMTRPTTRTEDMRRRQQAAELEYSDDEYDNHGFAPLSGDQAIFPRNHDNQAGSGDDGLDFDSESNDGDDNNPRQYSAAPSLASWHIDDDGDIGMQDNGAGAQLTAGNLQIVQEQFFAERQRGNAEDVAQGAQDGPAPDESREPSAEILLEKRRKKARRDRRHALQALHNHRANSDNIAEESVMAWREEDRHLLRKARLALIEQRRAFAGQTNVTTRAQVAAAEAVRNDQRSENDRHAGNREMGPDERRRGRRFPGADPDHSR